MSTKSLIDRLLHRATAEQQSQATSFADLVAATLESEAAVDEAAAAAVLRDCGKSAEDLQAAVALLQERRQWAVAAAGSEGCQQRLREIAERFEAIGLETIATRTRLAAEERALEVERGALMAAIATADQAQARLRATAPASTKTRGRELNGEKMMRRFSKSWRKPTRRSPPKSAAPLASGRTSRRSTNRPQRSTQRPSKWTKPSWRLRDVNTAIATADAESLLRQVVPDLDGVPCYLLTRDDSPRGLVELWEQDTHEAVS